MAATPSWPNLTKNNTGVNVKALQCLLNYRNNNTALSEDGSFGPAVYNAVVAFQKSKNLTANGIAGKDTLSKLVAVVQNGAVNRAVTAAQHLLHKFESLTIDGSFGSGCLTAVKAFQKRMELSVDGSIGPTTWQYLFGYDSYPGGGGTTPGTTPYKDYLGQDILTSSQVALLNGNKPFYQKAANANGIPWQMLAAVHFREYSLKKAGPSNGDGPYQIWNSNYPVGNYTDAQFQTATDAAAKFIKAKAGGRNLSVTDNVKRTFFAYNGAAQVYKTQALNLGLTSAQADNGEGSPYVMNRFDAKRDPTVAPTKTNKTWGQIKKDKGPIEYPANPDYGAFVLYQALTK